MQNWRFVDGLRGWSWQLVDADSGSVLKSSDDKFPTLYACVDDAKAHGFGAALSAPSAETLERGTTES